VGIAAAETALTAGNARTSDDDDPYVGDKTLTLGDAAITALTGNLRILGGGYLSLGFNVGVGAGSLTLEDGAFIALNAAANPFVTLGTTTITGDGSAVSYLTASGGTVTLAATRISGSGTLSIPGESGSPIIAVPASQTLSIAGVNLNLQANGSLTLGNNAATKVILEAGQTAGKITLSDEIEYTVTGLNNNVIATNGRVTGGILRGSAETGASTVGDLSGGAQSNLVISGSGIATTIAAGAQITL
jgi:hypothetical protein